MDWPWYALYPVMFATATLAGLIDSIAGGGGLVALPTLMAAGVPPHVALGTNKFQGSFGTLTASANYWRGGLLRLRDGGLGALFTLIGAAVGAATVQFLSEDLVGRVVPILLIIVVVVLMAKPSMGLTEGRAKMPVWAFFPLAGLALGFYDGFFGPGTGAFWVVAMMAVMGMTMTRATGYTKLMNFISNIVALAVFAWQGNIDYRLGLVMGVGQIVGASIGSRLALKRGAVVIRPVLLVVVAITTAKLVYDFWL